MNPLEIGFALTRQPKAELDAIEYRLLVLHTDGISKVLLQYLPGSSPTICPHRRGRPSSFR